MCECEESCCTSQDGQTEEGCPVDIVIAIDMCSCNNETWHDMKGKSHIYTLMLQPYKLWSTIYRLYRFRACYSLKRMRQWLNCPSSRERFGP